MNILERYAHLIGRAVKTSAQPRPGPEVVQAHECEQRAAGWFVRWWEARQNMARLLGTCYGAEETQAAGLSSLPNPRQLVADMEAIIESPGHIGEYSLAELRRAWRELSSTLEPILARLPDPETPA